MNSYRYRLSVEFEGDTGVEFEGSSVYDVKPFAEEFIKGGDWDPGNLVRFNLASDDDVGSGNIWFELVI